MTRNRQSAKKAGATFTRTIADYLAAQLDDDRIDVRHTNGAKDRGDIGAVKIHGQRLVLECKNYGGRLTGLPAWVDEAHIEAGNDDALTGLVIAKRMGTTNPGKQWVAMTVDDLITLITGQQQTPE